VRIKDIDGFVTGFLHHSEFLVQYSIFSLPICVPGDGVLRIWLLRPVRSFAPLLDLSRIRVELLTGTE
jgi:hypothetical protein